MWVAWINKRNTENDEAFWIPFKHHIVNDPEQACEEYKMNSVMPVCSLNGEKGLKMTNEYTDHRMVYFPKEDDEDTIRNIRAWG